jgi:hypothetical protein
MYIVGQEETAGESSVSVVAGVRTVTTNMDGRDVLPRLSRPSAFLLQLSTPNTTKSWPRLSRTLTDWCTALRYLNASRGGGLPF